MITVKNIKRSFANKAVLKDVSFTLPTGSLTGMIGPSGTGKSVLLKIIGKVLKPHEGEVDYTLTNGETVSLMFQEGALFDSMNVFDNVAFPIVNGKVPTTLLSRRRREEVHERVDKILAQVGLSKASYKMPGQISGGMRRRVSLARALVARPRLLLLDDPTSGLDPVASSVIMDLVVESHHQFKPTTLIVSHDLRRLLPVVDSVLALFEGHVLFHGKLDELEGISHPKLQHFIACRYDILQ